MSALISDMRCVVITPEAQVVDARVFDVVLPAYDGLRGVLPGHAPLMCRMGTGLLCYHDQQNRRQAVFVDGGFGHVQNNEVTILTPSALTSDDLTAGDAREQLQQAQALPLMTVSEVEARRQAIHRAQQLVALAEHKS